MSKPKVLVISDGAVSIRHCHHHWREFQSQFEVIVNDRHDRKGFIEGLKEGKYGSWLRVLTCRWDGVVAITKPQFEHGKGLGRFDEEIISQLPKSVRIITGAGAGYDWIDVEVLAKKGLASFCSSLIDQGFGTVTVETVPLRLLLTSLSCCIPS